MMSQSHSEGVTEEKFSAILSTIKRANTDNEKFAALLIVSKLTKAENLVDDKRRLLLKTIGFKFPIRLLTTACLKSSEENEDSVAYAAIGSSILSLFCRDDELVQENGIEESITPLLKTVEVFSKNSDKPSGNIMKDCLDALEGLLRNEKCANVITKNTMLEIICNIRLPHKDQALRILSTLLRNDPTFLNSPDNSRWLHSVINNLKNNQEIEKFEACDCLSFLLGAISQRTQDDLLMPLTQDIMYGIEEILCSKLTAEQRRPALILASEVLRLVGISNFICKSRKENFIVITARLACVEIGLFFRDAREKNTIEDESQLHLLMASFSVAECFCSAIAQFEQNEDGGTDVLSFDQIRLTQPALADMANSVAEFLTEFLPRWRDINTTNSLVLKSSIRMMGCWLNIENNVTSAQGLETLPLVPRIVSFVVLSRDWELLKTMLPVIMISADSSETLDVLLKSSILAELFVTLESFTKPSEAQEEETIVQLVLQSLLSIYASPNFTCIYSHTEVTVKIFNLLVLVCEKPLTPRLMSYVYSLAATLIKNLPEIADNADGIIEGVMEFLFQCHDITNSDGPLKVKESCKDLWPEISPLWQVCLQSMTECIRRKEHVKDMFLNSKHHTLLFRYFEAAKVSQNGDVINLFFNLVEASRPVQHRS